MPKRPPIDWQLIRMRYENGDSAYRIASDLGGRPTRQGIERRIAKEGWIKGQGSAITVASELPIVKQALALTGPTKVTAERVGFVIDLISRGATETLAARAAGIAPETLKRWKAQDPQLAEQLRQARAGKLAEWIAHIDSAAARDWKAADRLLQASGDIEGFTAATHGGVTVVLNIDRDGGAKPKGTIIDHNGQ